MFEHARLKIERANQHIADFDAQAAAFFGSDAGAHTVIVKDDPETGNQFVEITPVTSLPDQFALILGDALHNLHAALDYAWWERTQPVTGTDLSGEDKHRARFPIYPDRAELERFIKHRLKLESLLGIADKLLDEIQPYKRGKGESLYHLHQLDIADKHRLLTPQAQVNEITGLVVENEKGKRFSTKPKSFLSRPVVFRPPNSRNLKLIHEGYCTATIVLGKGTPIPGAYVVPLLRRLVVAVNKALSILLT